MFKGIKNNNLIYLRKVLTILLFTMFFIPKTAFAFTVTYKSYGGLFEDGTDTNVVEYDNEKNIISGEYKEPTNLFSCGNKIFTGWFADNDMKQQFYLRDNNDNITVYAGYNKYSSCYSAVTYGQPLVIRPSKTYNIQLWGSRGGTNSTKNNGAYVSGNLLLEQEKLLYVYVGNNTLYSNTLGRSFNGGGATEYSASAGGATDIRLYSGEWDDSKGLSSRIMVAAGGGGKSSSGNMSSEDIAYAGGLRSYNTNENPTAATAFGATQTRGGYPSKGDPWAASDPKFVGEPEGSFGKGGYRYNTTAKTGRSNGGGGGYYGGSHSGRNDASSFSMGTGGSSFISGHTGCVAITSENDLTPRNDSNGNQCDDGTTNNTCSIHYSGIFFTNTVMVDGAGYNWTTDKGEKTGMPNTDGSGTEIGHSTTGYAKATTSEETFHTVTFKHTGEDDFTVYVIDGEKVVRPNIYLTADTGYILHSWEINGTTTEWNFDDPVTQDLVLNSYVSLDIYSITYNIENGTVSGNPDTYTINDVPIILNNPTPNINGYIFTGWTGTGLTEKTMIVTIDTSNLGDKEYTAHFEKEKYTITYNLNGGELEQGVTNPEEYYVDSPDIALNNPSKEGYTFLGWTGSNGTTPTNVIIASGSTGNKTYTANYQIDRHTATFDSNLGTTAVPETITKDYNEALGTLPTTSRIGYIFEGWFTERDGGTQISSTTKMPALNPTYYAHWTPITYTIHFNSNNGTGSMADETMTYGISKALTENAFTRDGWTFAGWNTKADGSGTNYIDKQEIFNLTDIDGEEFTLFAKWTKDEYIITYNADGGQLDNPKTTYSVDDEEFTLVQPTKEGYTFTGWTGTGVSNPTKNVIIPTGSTGNRDYTAHWTATVYTIEYINNVTGETVLVAGNPTSYTVEDSDITLNNAGDYDTYHFYVGWTSDKDTESDLSDSYIIRTNQMKNLKIYAIYQTSPYTVSFDSDGGNDIDPISRQGTEDVGPLPTPIKEEYTFKGWFINNKLIDQTFHSRVDVTAIAKWEKISTNNSVNPKTGDNIMKYLMLLIISIIGLGYTVLKFKLKTKKVQ